VKNFVSLLFLTLVVGCTKHKSGCSFPTFNCLQGKWIEKEHTDTPGSIKEYINVYVENNREILDDCTFVAQLSQSQVALGEYYFDELAGEDSVALTPVWLDQPFHRYLKMVNENEIEIDYLQTPPIFKKIYIRQ
jgi:hypothetical protein